jgi:SAM-dependent methyltransferase
MSVDYDQLASQYERFRKPDPRIAKRIHFHLRGARQILNVGAGMGSYEPNGCEVVAVEPVRKMISGRRNAKALLVQGAAEALPFKDGSFDCSMGILTMHHWSDITAGLREMRRVTRGGIVLFTWTGYGGSFWLEEYIPEIKGIDEALFPTLEDLDRMLGGISVETVEIPHDCTDGFMCAYWRRPDMYLDPDRRRAISTFSRISEVKGRLDRLREDIESGVWRGKYGRLLEKESMDLGYRLVVSRK